MSKKQKPLVIGPNESTGYDLESIIRQLDEIARLERRSRSQAALILLGEAVDNYMARQRGEML